LLAMGGGVSIDFEAEQDSVAEPGSGKVILSGSIEEHCSYEAFLNELITLLSSCPPQADAVVKQRIYKEKVEGNPDEFSIKIVLDGALLQSYGFGDGDDSIAVNRDVKVDRAKRQLECWERGDKERPDRVSGHSMTRFLENPLRVEAYMDRFEDPESTESVKGFGDDEVNIWKYGFVDPICTILANTKVKCLADQPSKSCSGELVIMSAPMDEFVSCSALVSAMMPCIKENAEVMSGGAENVDIKENDDGSMHEMVIKGSIDLGDKGKKPTLTTCRFDKESMAYEEITEFDDKIAQKRFIRFFAEPHVTAECYIENLKGERVHGKTAARDFQVFLNGVVTKAESSGGLFSAISSMFG